MCVVYYQETGLPFLLHGLGCFLAFLMGLMPVAQPFAPVVLMFETSTIFLNVHWFCDKTGRSGTTLQWINGIFLLGAFFGSRIVYGSYRIYKVVELLWMRYAEVPAGIVEFYTCAGVAMSLLNGIWFSAMIKSLLSRFKNPKKTD
ncbi:hypothetical protein HDU91_000528 [Kappamyces sp. JEL0680]|nr:hypothetical protein HDU91_000528 [Kappamyces sp. JEL0680]